MVGQPFKAGVLTRGLKPSATLSRHSVTNAYHDLFAKTLVYGTMIVFNDPCCSICCVSRAKTCGNSSSR